MNKLAFPDKPPKFFGDIMFDDNELINNSCQTCVAASDTDRCNGYLDLKCNVGYLLGWNKVPFRERCNEIRNRNEEEIERKYPCRYHMTVEEFVKRIDNP